MPVKHALEVATAFLRMRDRVAGAVSQFKLYRSLMEHDGVTADDALRAATRFPIFSSRKSEYEPILEGQRGLPCTDLHEPLIHAQAWRRYRIQVNRLTLFLHSAFEPSCMPCVPHARLHRASPYDGTVSVDDCRARIQFAVAMAGTVSKPETLLFLSAVEPAPIDIERHLRWQRCHVECKPSNYCRKTAMLRHSRMTG